ncbi:hypothetical protein HPB51_014752 [Rhipicephalus microplus]|uniref:Membrane glycoprotein lig-1 n=1 Tax=Rhipicephalus microplus TaxID=6941 RepID=A0A9J6DMY3_RHIMP|nr:hypothetical protein HPB51_014752 [Rhipicephalus microplus]
MRQQRIRYGRAYAECNEILVESQANLNTLPRRGGLVAKLAKAPDKQNHSALAAYRTPKRQRAVFLRHAQPSPIIRLRGRSAGKRRAPQNERPLVAAWITWRADADRADDAPSSIEQTTRATHQSSLIVIYPFGSIRTSPSTGLWPTLSALTLPVSLVVRRNLPCRDSSVLSRNEITFSCVVRLVGTLRFARVCVDITGDSSSIFCECIHPTPVKPTKKLFLASPFNFTVMYSQISLLAAACLTAFSAYAVPDELVPDLCNFIDQPMYCRCDTADLTEEVTDVTCYVVRKLQPDHIVFDSLKRQPTITALAFNAFGGDYRLEFVPTQALRHLRNLERLKVSQAKLGDLKTHSFHNLSRLVVLSLDSNEITSLDTTSIVDLPRLKKLELADNKLRRLRAGSLKNLPALTQLFLERNQLELVDDGAFEDLRALRELELSDNAIQKLSEQSFRGLERVARLDLFRNKLTRLEARAFSAMPQLAELDLKYNELSEVDPLAFEGLPQLTVLYMSYNRLRVLPAHMFRGAPNLVSVDLSQNQLLTLTWRTVQDLAKIDAESFDMSLTGIRKFSARGHAARKGNRCQTPPLAAVDLEAPYRDPDECSQKLTIPACCAACGQTTTFPHMLWECGSLGPTYSKPEWDALLRSPELRDQILAVQCARDRAVRLDLPVPTWE